MAVKKSTNIVTDLLSFAFDTGFPLVSSSFDSYPYNLGEPTINEANTDTKRTIGMHATSAGNAGTIADASSEKGPGWKKITITAQGTNHRLAQFPYIGQNNTTKTYSIEYDFNGLTHSTGSSTSGYYWKLDGSNGNMGTNVKDTGKKKSMTYTNSSSQVMAIFLAHNTLNRSDLNEVIYFKNYQVEEKAHNTPFVETARDATGSLLPTINNTATYMETALTHINLATASFDNNGHLEFDGTDDCIILEETITLGNIDWTVEIVTNPHANGYNILSNNSGGPVTNAFGVQSSKIHYRNYDGAWQQHTGNIDVSLNKIHHLVWVNRRGESNSTGTMDMYVNGVKDSASGFNSFTTNGGPVNAIGRNWFSFYNGQIFLFRYYASKAFTDNDVKLSFDSLRDRFSI